MSEWRLRKRWEIVQFHYKNNICFRKKVGKKINSKWESLPILTKSDFQRPMNEVLTTGFSKNKVYISSTSGSSGHPFYFAKDKFTHALAWANIEARYKNLGINIGDLEARFYGIPKEPKYYYFEKCKDLIINRYRFSVFDLSDKICESYLNIFNKLLFKYVYGYTNSIVLFARFILSNNLNFKVLCPTLQCVIVTSEVCTKEDKELIGNAFKVPVYNEYGASEFGYIGYDDGNDSWAISENMLYIENDSDNNLLITDLHNKAYPFIRYKIGDNADIRLISGGQKRIRQLKGRTNDKIVLPSGKISPGLTFYYISRSVLEKTNILKEFIIKQTKLDYFIFDVVSSKPIDDQIISELQNKLEHYLEPGLTLEINRVKSIQRPNSGKIKHFYSMLD